MSVAINSNIPSYPNFDKSWWGPAWWAVMHQTASQFPEKPTRADKEEYKTLLNLLIKHLPCQDPCRKNALTYLNQHPFRFDSKSELFNSTCELHNHERESHGKPTLPCTDLLKSDNNSECSTCKVSPNTETAVVAADSNEKFDKYKELSLAIFDDLCKKEGISTPPIKFAPCPKAPETSCNLITDPEKPVIYLNPYTISLRQLLHEFHHYRDIAKDHKTSGFSEAEANMYAANIIRNDFPADIVADSTPIEAQKEPIIPDVMSDPELSNNNWENRFPYYNKVMEDLKQKKEKEEIERKNDEGVISYLDGIWKFPGEIVGLTASQANLANTPQIIKSALMLLVESNTTPLGSTLFSVLSGITLFIAGALTKDTLAYKDKLAMNFLSAAFIWDPIRQANPKTSHELKKNVIHLFQRIAVGNTNFTDLLLETPGMHEHKKHKEIMGAIQVMPHTARARASAYPAAENTNTIRMMQNESQRSSDSMFPAGPIVQGNMTPDEYRRYLRKPGTEVMINDLGFSDPTGLSATDPGIPLEPVRRDDYVTSQVPVYQNSEDDGYGQYGYE